ncbi:MAG: HDOD domain-containing protein [Tepidisphaeraceae bacterium]|jgi:putative nucleotidyltransferase with HDIG domain
MSTATVQGSQERLAELLGSLHTIATLPEITLRITECINDPASTVADLHRVLGGDPALVSRLLRLVNSAFYARATEIDSIQRAIVLLGFDAVHHLALAATMGQLFRGAHICEGYTGRDLWTHCIAVAAVSRELAHRTRCSAPEEVFLAGLLHDLGLLVSLQVCRGQLRRVCEQVRAGNTTFSTAELEIIGVGHEQLGSALARHWKFPESVCVVAAHHHDPSTTAPRWQTIAGIVHVADAICCCRSIGFDLTARLDTLDPACMQIVSPQLLEEATALAPEWAKPAIEILS